MEKYMHILMSFFSGLGYAVIALILLVAIMFSFALMASFMFAMVSEATKRGQPSEWQGIGVWCGLLDAVVSVVYCLSTGGIWFTIVSALGQLACMAVVTYIAWRVWESNQPRFIDDYSAWN